MTSEPRVELPEFDGIQLTHATVQSKLVLSIDKGV